MEQALADMDANTHLHVSFDVDFLDPEIAPGVGTTVPGGPSYREAQLCMEMIADTGRLASLDVVELNPALDVRNKTAVLAVDLLESLFGKSTLIRRPVDRAPAERAPVERTLQHVEPRLVAAAGGRPQQAYR
jgi:arginase